MNFLLTVLPLPPCRRQADLQRLDILINGEAVDALARICHRGKAPAVGRRLVAKLRDLMDRQQFEVALQVGLL